LFNRTKPERDTDKQSSRDISAGFCLTTCFSV
jgi:hypothetical protein